jgi:hypothetical protein
MSRFTNLVTASIAKPVFTGLLVALAWTAVPGQAQAAEQVSMAMSTTTSVTSATPASIANQAYRGELANIPSYQTLIEELSSGRLTANQVITAAGAKPSHELEQEVVEFIRIYGGDLN